MSTALLMSLALCLAQSDGATDEVVAVFYGQVVPFDGLLVSENRFVGLLQAGVKSRQLAAELKVERHYNAKLEETYQKEMEKRKRKWYESPSLNRGLGILIGVGLTLVVFLAGAELAQAVSR